MGMMNDLVAAAAQHGVPVVILGLQGEEAVQPENVAPPPPWEQEGGNDEELQQLRAQVQGLSAELQAAQAQLNAAPQVPAGAPPEAGDAGSWDDQPTTVLGFEDEKLQNKLLRLGFDTIGKLREGYMEGRLASDHKLKKDWLIAVGMQLAGAAPSGSAPVPAAAPAVGVGADVPEGHADRPWPERLGAARSKHATLDNLRQHLMQKREEAQKLQAAGDDAGFDALDEQIIKLEEDIDQVAAQCVAIRWCLNLDPDTNLSLDEALDKANLGPWKQDPTPRLIPAGAGA